MLFRSPSIRGTLPQTPRWLFSSFVAKRLPVRNRKRWCVRSPSGACIQRKSQRSTTTPKSIPKMLLEVFSYLSPCFYLYTCTSLCKLYTKNSCFCFADESALRTALGYAVHDVLAAENEQHEQRQRYHADGSHFQRCERFGRTVQTFVQQIGRASCRERV